MTQVRERPQELERPVNQPTGIGGHLSGSTSSTIQTGVRVWASSSPVVPGVSKGTQSRRETRVVRDCNDR